MPEPLTIFACPDHPTQVRLDGLGRCPVRYSMRERCDLAFVPVRVLPEDDPRVLPEGMTRDHVRRLWRAASTVPLLRAVVAAVPAPPEWTETPGEDAASPAAGCSDAAVQAFYAKSALPIGTPVQREDDPSQRGAIVKRGGRQWVSRDKLPLIRWHGKVDAEAVPWEDFREATAPSPRRTETPEGGEGARC